MCITGDFIFAINGEDIVSNLNAKKGIELLTQIQKNPINNFTHYNEQTGKPVNQISFTVARFMYNDTTINVTGCHAIVNTGFKTKSNGINNCKLSCNGEYKFDYRDEFGCPVFAKQSQGGDIDDNYNHVHDDGCNINGNCDINTVNTKAKLFWKTVIYVVAFDRPKYEFTWCIGTVIERLLPDDDDGDDDEKQLRTSKIKKLKKMKKVEKVGEIKNFYIGSSLSREPPINGWKWTKNTQWDNVIRYIWIGYHKNDKKCFFARLSSDVVDYILKFINFDLESTDIKATLCLTRNENQPQTNDQN